MGNIFFVDYGMCCKLDGEWMNCYFQFELLMFIIGLNVDYCVMICLSEQVVVFFYLFGKFGVNSGVFVQFLVEVKVVVDEVYKFFRVFGKMLLVVCGFNNMVLQILINKLNSVIGVYGMIICLEKVLNLFQFEDVKMQQFVVFVIGGKVLDVIFFYNVNLVYNMLEGDKLGVVLISVLFMVVIFNYVDEMVSKCNMIVVDYYVLESWMDYNLKVGYYVVVQLMICLLYDMVLVLEILFVWVEKVKCGGKDFKVVYDFIFMNWQKYGFFV